MPKFQDTEGLIVDVRGNYGGTSDVLRLFYSYICKPEGSSRVARCVVPLISPEFNKRHLEERLLYSRQADVWTSEERQVVVRFQEGFSPEWNPTPGRFGQWHYSVLSKQKKRGIYHYDKPVVILMDSKCFSAADVFLSALKGMSNVTLVGTPSVGGNGGSEKIIFPGMNFGVQISNFVGFQANGKMFDGHGVQPDVRVEPNLAFFIGGQDSVLERGIEVVRGNEK